MLDGHFIATLDLKHLLMDTEQRLYFLALAVIKMFSAREAKDLIPCWGKLHKMAVHIHHRRHRFALPKKPQPSKFSSLRRVTVTGNGLRCFPAPVNRLPACEGVRWVWYRILFNPETTAWPLGPSIPHAAHPSHGAIERMGYGGAFPRGGSRKSRLGREEQQRRRVADFTQAARVTATMAPPTAFAHLRCTIPNSLFCHAPSCCTR